MKAILIGLVAALLVVAACMPVEKEAPVKPKPQLARTAVQPVAEPAPAVEPAVEQEYAEMADIDSTIAEADLLEEELDFTELDELDNELKELDKLEFE